MKNGPYSIPEINAMSGKEFRRVVGPVFEHSPWIAEKGAGLRSFSDIQNLHETLCNMVSSSPLETQIALIQAHPDLVGRAALRGSLNCESTREQASAGLANLTRGEIELFQKFNAAYRKKFGFPFVICARLNKKKAILDGFAVRMKNERSLEIKIALDEIFQIARLRLQDVVQS